MGISFKKKYEKKMIVASIDIGSNTVLLLTAEVDPDNGELRTIKNYYHAPRISEGLKPGLPIKDIKIKKLFDVLTIYEDIIKEVKCEKVFVAATNAFRIASNAEELVEKIKTEFDWDVKIIDGETEAKLSFWGSTYPFDGSINKSVIDIGGGSTEIIYGNKNDILYRKSFQIGVVSLTEKAFTTNPPSSGEIYDAEIIAQETLVEIVKKIPQKVHSLAVAGTPTTLSCIKQNLKFYNEEKVENSILTYKEIENLLIKILPLNKNEMSEQFGQVVEGREDILLAGTIILKSFMKVLKIDEITVSSKGLRYGTIVDYFFGINK